MLVVMAFGLPGAARAQAVGTFQKRSSSPVPVTGLVVDPTTNLIYAQGYDATTLYVYDPSRNTWAARASAPSDLSYDEAGAAYLNGKIYIAYPASDTTMYVYDIASNSWSSMPNPLGTGTAAITSSGGELYLAGGGPDGIGFVSYNPATNTTKILGAAPIFNSDCGGTGFNPTGTLVAYAGNLYANQASGCTGFATYAIATDTWNLLNPPGDALVGAAINPVAGTYYTSGYDSSDTPSFYVGNIAKHTWAKTPFPYADLDDGGMAYVSTRGLQGIYATYGLDSTGFTRFVPGLSPARLKLTATPHGGTAGKRVCINFKATSSGKAVNLAAVKFANHSRLTKKSGQARLCVTLKKKGTYRATASKTGYLPANATVNLKAPRRPRRGRGHSPSRGS
jgi:hypothetical protein